MRAKNLLVTAAALAVGLILFVVWQLDTSTSSPAEVHAPAALPGRVTEDAALSAIDLHRVPEQRNDVAVEPDPSVSATPRVRTLSILVTNSAGRPIADAEVRSDIDEYDQVQRTDAEGRAEIVLPAERSGAQLHVDADGYHHARNRAVASQLVEVRLRRLAAVAGRVLDADTSAGIGGADVWLSDFPCRLCTPPRTVTDAAGGFELSDLPLGARSVVKASAEGFVAGERSFVLREDGSQLEFWLDPGVEFWLEVSDFETGAAITGARIARRGAAEVTVPPTGRLRTAQLLRREDHEVVRLSARAEGYCALDFSVDPRTQPAGELVRLRLPRPVSVTGVVRDPSGAPIAGARITAKEDRKSAYAKGAKPASSPLDELPKDWRVRRGDDYDGTWSDTEGRFELAGLPPWAPWVRISVIADGHEQLEWPLEPGLPGSVLAVNLTVQPTLTGTTGAVSGRMTLNGEGLGGRLTWKGPGASGSGRVDDEGRFELVQVEPGRVRVRPRPSHWSEKCADSYGDWIVEVVAGETSELDIAFELGLARIQGRVLAAEGEPAPGVSVRAEADGNCMAHRAVTDDDGRFALEVDQRFLSYTLSAWVGPDPVEVHGVAPGSEGVVLKLADVTTLRYRVVDRDTRRPIVGSRLLWRRPGEERYRTRGFGRRGLADPEGWHEVDFAEGFYELGVSMARQDAGYLPTFVDGVHLGEEGGTLLFEVERGIELEVSSRGEQRKNKKPNKKRWPKDVTVLLLDLEYLDGVTYKAGKDSWKWGPDLIGLDPLNSWKLSLDKLGTAHLNALRPGLHRFRSFPPGIRIHPAEVDVRPNMDPIEIQWSRAGE